VRASWIGNAALPLLAACATSPDYRTVDLTAEFVPVRFGGEGDIHRDGEGLVLEPGSPLTGGTFSISLPTTGYELELAVARLGGVDFFCGLTLPTSRGCLTLVLGGWGGAVCGLSCLDGLDAARNTTRTLRHFVTAKDYAITVRVDGEAIAVAIDSEPLFRAELGEQTVAVRAEVELTEPFGFCCYATKAALRYLRWRAL
jgi:hypothetical protein